MIVHLNGHLLPVDEARISPLDRGFVFGDGLYEGLRAAAIDGRTHVVGLDRHIERMRGGLAECGIEFDPRGLRQATYDLLEANSMRDAFVYWQVTRGTPRPGDPPRTRVPRKGMTPTVFGYCAPQPPLVSFSEPPRKTAVTLEDIRWTLGHIKSISLMGNIVLTMRADAAGAEEAIFVRSGLVGEGTATNVLLAIDNERGGREVVTPALDCVPILRGVTRTILLEADPAIVERPIRVHELARASEVMVIGSTTMVTSIVRLDGRIVGEGRPGPEAARLLRLLLDAIRREAGVAPAVRAGA